MYRADMVGAAYFLCRRRRPHSTIAISEVFPAEKKRKRSAETQTSCSQRRLWVISPAKRLFPRITARDDKNWRNKTFSSYLFVYYFWGFFFFMKTLHYVCTSVWTDCDVRAYSLEGEGAIVDTRPSDDN